MNKEAKILIGIAVIVVIAGAVLAIFANPQPEQPSDPVDEQSLIRENSHMTSSPDAKVNLVEFGDFQCPACAQAHPVVKTVLAEFADNPDVNFVFRNFPLDTIHPNAHIAAEAAEAAADQGKFWEMHDLLYQNQDQWSTLPNPLEAFVEYAIGLELNVDKFRSAVSSRLYTDVITSDYNDGTNIGVNSTPTFFLNGQKLSGFNPQEVLKQITAILAGEPLSTEEQTSQTGASSLPSQQPVTQPEAGSLPEGTPQPMQ